MPTGPGKYDAICTKARVETKALGVAMIVIGGTLGDGFSCQMPLPLTIMLPEMLRRMADDIEASLPRS